MSRIIDLFFPKQCKCIFCGRETRVFGICDACGEHLPYIHTPTCDICGGNNMGDGRVCIECKGHKFNFHKCYCILNYEGSVRDKIISFKQNGAKHIGEALAYLIEKKYYKLKDAIDIIIPVPISKERLATREFNQTEVLCGNLITTGLVNTGVLERVKETPHQTGLSRENRINNLKEAFKVTDKQLIKGKNILIVDDIYTTGSTLNECASVLIKNGANKVVGLCLARTPVRKDSIIK